MSVEAPRIRLTPQETIPVTRPRRTALLVRFLLILAACLIGQSGFTAEPRPNVVFILADDWGWIDAGDFGSPLYETPHIHRLASEGMRLTNAYAAHPVCGPSRMAIQLGRHKPELYDLSKDISETDDLSEERPELTLKLLTELNKARQK